MSTRDREQQAEEERQRQEQAQQQQQERMGQTRDIQAPGDDEVTTSPVIINR